MTKFGDLAVHAQRCEELAEICTDRTIALKLRALAVEYRDMAKRSTIVTPVLVMKKSVVRHVSVNRHRRSALNSIFITIAAALPRNESGTRSKQARQSGASDGAGCVN
jgi:hypothetical protein